MSEDHLIIWRGSDGGSRVFWVRNRFKSSSIKHHWLPGVPNLWMTFKPPFSLFYFPAAMYREKLPLFLKSFLRSFSPCHKTTKETTSKTTYWTRKQRCLGLQEQPKDPQIKLENLQPKKLKCLQQEQSKSLQLKQGCIKEP